MIAFLLSGLGRKIMAGVALALAVLAAVARIFAAGKQSAQTQGMKEQLDNVKTRSQVDDAVARQSGDAVRDELRRDWVGR